MSDWSMCSNDRLPSYSVPTAHEAQHPLDSIAARGKSKANLDRGKEKQTVQVGSGAWNASEKLCSCTLQYAFLRMTLLLRASEEMAWHFTSDMLE